MKKPPFIMVIWKDTCQPDDDQPHDVEYFENPDRRNVVFVSVGVALKDDEEGVVLCRDYRLREEQSETEISICKEYILEKRYLK